MPPQNPTPVVSPPSAPSSSDQFDFFLQPKAPQKRPLVHVNSLQKRLMVIVGGLAGLVILIAIISSLFSHGSSLTPSITVAQDQTELSRVAAEASGQSSLQSTLNLAESVQLSLTSSQQQWLSYLTSNGHKLTTAQLTATKDTRTDQQLTAAEAASNFDAVFDQVMQSGLHSYLQDLNTAYPTVGPKGKTELKTDYAGAKLLLSQATAASPALSSQ